MGAEGVKLMGFRLFSCGLRVDLLEFRMVGEMQGFATSSFKTVHINAGTSSKTFP